MAELALAMLYRMERITMTMLNVACRPGCIAVQGEGHGKIKLKIRYMSLEQIYAQPRAATVVRCKHHHASTLATQAAFTALCGRCRAIRLLLFMHVVVQPTDEAAAVSAFLGWFESNRLLTQCMPPSGAVELMHVLHLLCRAQYLR